MLAALLPAVEAAGVWLFKLVVDVVLVRTKLFARLQTLEPDALDRRRHGDVLARLTGDVHAIETLLLSAAGELVQAAARILFFGAALFLLSWRLALAALIVVPVFAFAAHRFARLARRAARERRRRSGSLTAVAEEALGNAALVQVAGTQERELARFRREGEGKLHAELAGTRISGLFAPVIDLIELTGAVLVIVLGTLALAGGDLTLGGLLAFLAYLAQLYRPVRDVSRLGQTIFETATCATSRCARCASTSASCSRTRRCSTARSATTSPTAGAPPNDKWEVIVEQSGRKYEVELAGGDLRAPAARPGLVNCGWVGRRGRRPGRFLRSILPWWGIAPLGQDASPRPASSPPHPASR